MEDVNAKVFSIPKRQKTHGEGKHVTTGEGILERLPDEILFYALSFLETKDAVRTSVLSKRWKYVWTSVPSIRIYGCPCSTAHRRHFFDSIERMLHLNAVSLQNLHDVLWLDELISSVVKRDMEELELSSGLLCFLPPSVFNCKNLVILKLNHNILPELHSSVYLPRLKILHIGIYRELFYKEYSMKHLLDGCPVIEELNIMGVRDCRVPHGNELFVGSSSLKSLRIQCVHRNNDIRIVLDVPNVEQLDLDHFENEQYEIICISSLVKLTINAHPRRLVELLWKFTNTKYLSIYRRGFGHLRILDDFPKFLNLTHLAVHDIDYKLPVLLALLEYMPKLVTFTYFSSFIDREVSSTEQHMQIKAPNCLMLYLEEIKLTRFKGFVDEMAMARYFLKNSMVLKKLSIWSKLGAKIELEISNKILNFPRGSPECQIIIE